MPWHKETDKEGCNGIAVVKDDDGSIAGCHENEAQADSQIAALYASEEDKDGKAPKYKQYTYNGVSCQATSRRSSSRDDKKYMRDVKVGDTERLVHYGDPNLPMQRDIPERRENFLARHNCSEKKDPFAPGFWACLDWQRTEEGKAMIDFQMPEDIASELNVKDVAFSFGFADENKSIKGLNTIILTVGEEQHTYFLKADTEDCQCEDQPLLKSNCLKALEKTEDEIVIGNYIVLFGGRDLEGIASPRKNPDGSIGEYFTKNTSLESDYTSTGMLHIDWEHGQRPEEGPGKNNVLGYVDWKSVEVDDKGVFVRRVLNRRNRYVKFLEELIEAGMVGTSSEPVQEGVVKGADGEIISWPLMRDSLTVTPIEPRMMTENQLIALKSLAEELPVIKEIYKAAGLELFEDGKEPQEAAGAVCEDNHQLEQAQAIAEAVILLIEIEGV